MAIGKIFKHITIVGLFCVVFVWGCAQQAEQEPAKMTSKAPRPGSAAISLKPTPGQENSYKITTHARRNIKWQGPVPQKDAFEDSATEEQVEMNVTQHIQSVDASGKAVAKVTIDSLKYISIVKNQTNIDFDSSRQSDADSPLTKLIGQSYTIEFGPDNYVSSVLDLSQAQSLMSGRTAADRAGESILSPDAIAERHAALLLPQAEKEYLKPGESWSRVKTFSFGMMGVKSYEKIYTLQGVQDTAGHRVAVVGMNAIPTSEIEERFKGPQTGKEFPKMFDTNEIYAGAGEVDLTAGCLNNYHENLQTSWITAFPSNVQPDPNAPPNEPVVLRMTAMRNYSFEKIK